MTMGEDERRRRRRRGAEGGRNAKVGQRHGASSGERSAATQGRSPARVSPLKRRGGGSSLAAPRAQLLWRASRRHSK